ncbi:probable tetraacyldisaccharide 4'-kinase, mitochondrial isoform X1 [Olea europaea var. sylvestris]|uniref:probable tetraacyldisaccharide 4'-kinase, mitochondrial isoform X1 n=2 Tax=Olea europaea var. sylvestris TaxID=158386 RepID=UPI000C1D5EF3|nr:probable tetraacyldisaccharide 4'-kinase, mitochondrial isoform X1 [Olea europaea var. sylvestris]
MEKLRRAVNQVAYTPLSQRFSSLSPLQLSLIPLLSLASNLYRFAISLRHRLFRLNLLTVYRLPVPVISVGNLTWGGNGKTPMVEFVARLLADTGIPPLILTRGYGGADEAKMLQRHLCGTSAKIGVGANRAATAYSFLKQYGYMNLHNSTYYERLLSHEKVNNHSNSGHIGAAILDDGMQHLSLWRDLEIVMVNAMMPWGNGQLLPLGPLREPLTALNRADIIVIHHADLVAKHDIEALESTIREVQKVLPVFFTKMAPSHFLRVGNMSSRIPLNVVDNKIVLCVSGIGFADSFIQRIEEMGPTIVDRLDFSDHHLFQLEDLDMISARLEELESKFATKPVVIVTEKDYDRAPNVLENLKPFDVLVLCCNLQILAHKGSTEDGFKLIIKQHLKQDDRV